MYFNQLSKIVTIERGESITTHVDLSGEETYLADHFPKFACMPGVLMIESMFQSSAWLLRHANDFTKQMVMLKEARNVKYGNFLTPGKTLIVEMKKVKDLGDDTFRMKGQGTIDGEAAVSGILIVRQFNLAESVPHRARMDAIARKHYIEDFNQLYTPETVVS